MLDEWWRDVKQVGFSLPIWYRLPQLWKQMKPPDCGAKATGHYLGCTFYPRWALIRFPTPLVLFSSIYIYSLCIRGLPQFHACVYVNLKNTSEVTWEETTMTLSHFRWEFEAFLREQKIHLLTQKKNIIMSGWEINPHGTGGTPPLSLLQPLWSPPAFLSETRLCSWWWSRVSDIKDLLKQPESQEEEMDKRKEEVQKSNSGSSLPPLKTSVQINRLQNTRAEHSIAGVLQPLAAVVWRCYSTLLLLRCSPFCSDQVRGKRRDLAASLSGK